MIFVIKNVQNSLREVHDTKKVAYVIVSRDIRYIIHFLLVHCWIDCFFFILKAGYGHDEEHKLVQFDESQFRTTIQNHST